MNNEVTTMLELPKGWVWATVSATIEKVPLGGRKLKRSEYQEEGILPVIDQGQIFVGGYTDRQELKAPCEPPVIIFGDHTKVIKYVNFDFVAGADGVRAIKPLGAFSPKLFYYFLQAIELPEKGYARHFQFLEKSFIPLPPLPEQHRIVAKIEELFTRLDAGGEALKKIKAQLKRYRQSVLKHAFEGRLTEEWRQAHKGELEPASALLDRIKQERHRTTKGKYKELPPLDTSDLPELPEGWVWARIGDISEAIQYGYTASSTFEPAGPKMLRITDIQNNSVDWDAVPYCRIETEAKAKYLLKDGDLVFARTGATVGKSFLIRDTIPESVFASYLIRIALSRHINKTFVYSFFQSYHYWMQIYAGQLGIGQPNVNSQTLSRIFVPLSPTLEQHRIVEEIERRFSVADQIEKTVGHSLKQAERLRQSILKRAFEGKLVPQDPNDEPAEKLLERIRQEGARQQAERKPAKSSRDKSNTKQMKLV